MPKNSTDPKKELDDLVLEAQTQNLDVEKFLDTHSHTKKDHYHDVHHFDKFGHHDDISEKEFTLKELFGTNKRIATFQIAATGIILALAIGLSALDMLFEHISINIGGVAIDMRIFDLTIIIIGLPIAGFYGSLFVGFIEPWFHLLIDGDHHPLQVLFDSIDYMLVVVIFFLIYFAAFKNSPIHKEPNKKRRLFKHIVPGLIIVPVLSLLFSVTFILALYIGVYNSQPTPATSYWVLFFISLGMQLLRFSVMYSLFVLVENKLKPIVHLYH